MKNQHVINTLPTWVECYHKDNKRKTFLKLDYADVDYYQFLIYRNEKYENNNSYIAGYFLRRKDKFVTDRFLFKVNGFYIDEVYDLAVQTYNQLKSEGAFVETRRLEEEKWARHSPFD